MNAVATTPDNAYVWSSHARQWHRVGPPLRPSQPDADLMVRLALAGSAAPNGACLVLGVTPELVGQAWLAERKLWAVDHSEAMVRALWNEHTPAVRAQRHVAINAHWQRLPLADGEVALAIGDGSLNALPSLDEVGSVRTELHRVLAPSGCLVLRAFIRPEAGEPIDSVVSAVHERRIGGFDAFKWRLAMAMVHPRDASVAVADIAHRFDSLFPDRDALAARTGWPAPSIASIDAYQGSATRYNFPTLSQLKRALSPHFSVVTVEHPNYELGERCPTLAARRNDALC